MAGIQVDGANQKVVLDSDGDTYLEAATDDTIKVYVAGAHDATISANAINVLSGTTLTIDSGATIANSGTATGFSSADPASADGDSLGTASLEWSDLFLADGGIIKFGNDQDVLLTHVADTGLLLNSTNVIQFNDASQNIGAPSATVLDINATDEIELNATAVDLNGTLDVSGNSQFSGTVTVGVNDTGKDVKFFGATSGAFTLYDESADSLIVRQGASGATATTDANNLVVEGSGITGISLLTAAGEDTGIYFGDNDDNDIGFINYSHNGNIMMFKTNTSEAMRMTSTGQISTGGETAPNVTAGGLCLNQGAEDGAIMEFKSSDTDHPNTSHGETDTYGLVMKYHATESGLLIRGFGEGTSNGVNIKSYVESTPLTGEAINQYGAFGLNSSVSNGGTNSAGIANDGNAFTFNNDGSVKFIIKGNGDFYYDGADQGAYDTYDDAHLARAVDLSHGINTVDSKFDKFVSYNAKKLAELKLIGKDENGKPTSFINSAGMQRLHNGAIWQQYEKHNQLLEAVYDLAKLAVGEEKANAILDKHEVKRLQ